jgi:hypothetical protein
MLKKTLVFISVLVALVAVLNHFSRSGKNFVSQDTSTVLGSNAVPSSPVVVGGRTNYLVKGNIRMGIDQDQKFVRPDTNRISSNQMERPSWAKK